MDHKKLISYIKLRRQLYTTYKSNFWGGQSCFPILHYIKKWDVLRMRGRIYWSFSFKKSKFSKKGHFSWAIFMTFKIFFQKNFLGKKFLMKN